MEHLEKKRESVVVIGRLALRERERREELDAYLVLDLILLFVHRTMHDADAHTSTLKHGAVVAPLHQLVLPVLHDRERHHDEDPLGSARGERAQDEHERLNGLAQTHFILDAQMTCYRVLESQMRQPGE